MSKELTKLPTLEELNQDVAIAFKQDQFNLLLNQQPPASWIKQHPTIKTKNERGEYVPLSFLPIEKVEFLLTKIFQLWYPEVLNIQQLFNSVAVTVRLHYKHPMTGEWMHLDGVGACGVQTDKGASASDLNSIKQAAVMMALPAAKSYAIKDAADHLGKLFGKDLNRHDVLAFKPTYNDIAIEDLRTLYREVEHLMNDEEKKHFDRIVDTNEKNSFKKLFNELNKKKNG